MSITFITRQYNSLLNLKYGVFGMNIKKSGYTQKIFEQYKTSITDSGFAIADSEWNSNFVCSPFSRLYYVSGGSAEIRIKDRVVTLTPGKAYLIPLGTKYSCYCDSTMEHLYFHINIDAPNGYDLLRGAECVSCDIPIEKIMYLKNLYFSRSFNDQMKLKYELYHSIQLLLAAQPSDTEFEFTLSPDIIKTIEYIRNNLSIQLTTADIADSLFLSKNTLAKQFRREVGLPIGKYIDKLIFFEAEKMLTKTNVSLKEISDSLGFCDQFYFSRRFQQLFEESPLAYRKRTKNSAT